MENTTVLILGGSGLGQWALNSYDAQLEAAVSISVFWEAWPFRPIVYTAAILGDDIVSSSQVFVAAVCYEPKYSGSL